jgi:hypothetical protein
MHTKLTLCALGIYLLTAAAAARVGGRSWFEAHTAGTQALTLRGTAEFGPVKGDEGNGTFVLTLGSESPTGAVLFTSRNGALREPGVYALSVEPSEGLQALVVTGPPSSPTGAYRAQSGTLTITRAREDALEGRFEIDAVGFEAARPAAEDRELVVRGTFTASPGR